MATFSWQLGLKSLESYGLKYDGFGLGIRFK